MNMPKLQLLVYVWNTNSIMTAPAYALRPISARPSAGLTLTRKLRDDYNQFDIGMMWEVIASKVLPAIEKSEMNNLRFK